MSCEARAGRKPYIKSYEDGMGKESEVSSAIGWRKNGYDNGFGLTLISRRACERPNLSPLTHSQFLGTHCVPSAL